MNGKVGTTPLLLPAISVLYLVKTLSRKGPLIIDTNTSLEKNDHRRSDTAVENEASETSVEANPCQTVRGPAKQHSVNPATISRRVNAIGKVKKMVKWIPRELKDSQKMRRLEAAVLLSIRNTHDLFLSRNM
ncbi:hypothetical protein NECAME_12370 [Necator americanus]|uniref:Uncharacterized protein n=1 Tax=Necator americanus TaxID=51031 RepID=W2T1L3_NECAM|nr:hypothetical protein NECAME_12370 [Necator americanus]ETN75459.1 hypothetical protein NECAME_12370 [Necator americanus]